MSTDKEKKKYPGCYKTTALGKQVVNKQPHWVNRLLKNYRIGYASC